MLGVDFSDVFRIFSSVSHATIIHHYNNSLFYFLSNCLSYIWVIVPTMTHFAFVLLKVKNKVIDQGRKTMRANLQNRQCSKFVLDVALSATQLT